jgi:serine/threonine protein phosphatase PrpC
MMVKAAGRTDIGLVRKVNEDCIRLLEEKSLFIVCDGMGGHNAGEIASSAACDVIATLYDGFLDRLLQDDRLRLPRVLPPSTDVLTKTVRIANHHIFQQAAADSSLTGMGTTIAAIAIEKDVLTILHVGDSRVYRFFNNRLTRLTVDHSWVAELEQNERISPEEARTLVNRNVITRALGVKENVEIDVAVRRIVEDDIYILCSDGLCGYAEDSDIEQVTVRCDGSVEKIAAELVKLANDRGGPDNVSIVAVKITGPVAASDLSPLAAVTVDGEPREYFVPEEEWAQAATACLAEETKPAQRSGAKRTGLIASCIAILVIIVLFYLIFKG